MVIRIRRTRQIIEKINMGDNFTHQGKIYRAKLGAYTAYGFIAWEAPGGKQMVGKPVEFQWKK